MVTAAALVTAVGRVDPWPMIPFHLMLALPKKKKKKVRKVNFTWVSYY